MLKHTTLLQICIYIRIVISIHICMYILFWTWLGANMMIFWQAVGSPILIFLRTRDRLIFWRVLQMPQINRIYILESQLIIKVTLQTSSITGSIVLEKMQIYRFICPAAPWGFVSLILCLFGGFWFSVKNQYTWFPYTFLFFWA